jgi:hypothetical protein
LELNLHRAASRGYSSGQTIPRPSSPPPQFGVSAAPLPGRALLPRGGRPRADDRVCFNASRSCCSRDRVAASAAEMAASPATAYRRLAGLGERLHRELLRRPNVAARIDCPLAAIFVRFLGGPQTYRVITPGRRAKSPHVSEPRTADDLAASRSASFASRRVANVPTQRLRPSVLS